MTERVVDPLEVIEIEEENGHDLAVTSGVDQREAEALVEEPPVPEPRQAVVIGEEADLLLGAASLGDVLRGPGELDRNSGFIQDGIRLQMEVSQTAIWQVHAMIEALRHFRDHVAGTPTKIIHAHLIMTPEYIRALHGVFPEVIVYAIRLDRGTSPEDVLSTVPGSDPRETGLDGKQYIVPGGGGFGEILNNAEI